LKHKTKFTIFCLLLAIFALIFSFISPPESHSEFILTHDEYDSRPDRQTFHDEALEAVIDPDDDRGGFDSHMEEYADDYGFDESYPAYNEAKDQDDAFTFMYNVEVE
jgi:hypothetical protein